jgi:hypothetical protein
MGALRVGLAAAAAHAVAAAPATTLTLASDLLQVQLTIAPNGTCVSALAFSLALAGDDPVTAGWTADLLSHLPPCGGSSSSSALQVAGSPDVLLPRGGVVAASNATAATLTGITLGGVATETWTLAVEGAALTWAVERVYSAAGAATLDVPAALWLQTTVGSYDPGPPRGAAGGRERGGGRAAPPATPTDWRTKVQMPSFLSLDDGLLEPVTGQLWSPPGAARSYALGDAPDGDARRVLLSPASVAAHLALSHCRFAFGMQNASWITQQLSLGGECALGPGAPPGGVPFAAGDTVRRSLSLALVPATNGHGWFDLRLPDGAPTAAVFAANQSRSFAGVYNMMLGWVNGNSPASETCIHEASLFSQLQGLYRSGPPPPDAGAPAAPATAPPTAATLHAAADRQISFILERSLNATGWVYARWSARLGNWDGSPEMALTDQFPHLLLAAYYHAVNTNDTDAVARWMPALDRVLGYMLGAQLVNATGLMTNTVPWANGRANASAAGNWLDGACCAAAGGGRGCSLSSQMLRPHAPHPFAAAAACPPFLLPPPSAPSRCRPARGLARRHRGRVRGRGGAGHGRPQGADRRRRRRGGPAGAARPHDRSVQRGVLGR